MKNSAEERAIFITEYDLARLEELLEKVSTEDSRDSKHLNELGDELLRAEVVEPRDIPADVITMNSQVCLKDLDSGEELVYTLVFPNDARLEENRISILAPVGTALLGYRVADTIKWKVPGGIRRLKVKKMLYQPEASGDFHL